MHLAYPEIRLHLFNGEISSSCGLIMIYFSALTFCFEIRSCMLYRPAVFVDYSV